MALFSKTHDLKYRRLLKKALSGQHALSQLYKEIVNAPFKDPLLATYISLGIVVLLIVDENKKTINRVALSDTMHAEGATRTSEKAFHEIVIPLNQPDNIIAQAIHRQESLETDDWKDLFVPALEPLSARLNQASAGIAYSMVVPLKSHQQGALIFSFFKHNDNYEPAHDLALYFADIVSDRLDELGR